MKKIYLENLIPFEEYVMWLHGKKVVINAPTGLGKTYFMLHVFLKLCEQRQKKIMFLCNRRLLEEQYETDLAAVFSLYENLKSTVEIRSYQELEHYISCGGNLKTIFEGVDVIVMDEVHYFYSDSDFNGMGTYALLQRLVEKTFFKTVIMLTATFEEVRPLIEKIYSQYKNLLEQQNLKFDWQKYCYTGQVYNFLHLNDSTRFHAKYIPEEETLIEEIVNSNFKTLMFIDDVAYSKVFSEKLVLTKKIKASDIMIINAKELEQKLKTKNIRSITCGSKLPVKVVITTCVLDNGVSIHDEELGNLVIASEDKVSFCQMVGRVRSEKTNRCNLYIFPREIEYYQKRHDQYEEKIKKIEELEKEIKTSNTGVILSQGWNDGTEQGVEFRNFVLPINSKQDYYIREFKPIVLHRESYFAINQFAKAKVGNNYLTLKRLLKLSYKGMEKVVEHQLKWVGIEEYFVETESYSAKRKEVFKGKLLEIQSYGRDEMKAWKLKVYEEFREDILSGSYYKNGSFSKSKLLELCAEYELELVQEKDEKGHVKYTVTEFDDAF